MSLYLPQIVTSRSYRVMVLDHYSTTLSPLFHSLLMEWCVYKPQEWYPLSGGTYSAYLLVFTECCEVLRLQIMFASLQQCATLSEEHFLFVGCANWNSKRVWIAGLRAGWLQTCRRILKLLCDHRFKPREVCRKTNYLYSVACFYFLHWYQSIYRLFSMSQAYMISS